MKFSREGILWLIRERSPSWKALCDFFRVSPRSTVAFLMKPMIRELEDAGLITVSGPAGELRWRQCGHETSIDDFVFQITPLATQVLSALNLSLRELAENPSGRRMIVTPLYSPQKAESADILVLMPFHQSLRALYDDQLKSVAARAGLSIIRADDFFLSGHVVDQVWSAIVQAKILIADCSGRNANVFYEIGLAHAIGKPVILIASNEDDVPFDLRHQRFVRYELGRDTMPDFEEKLLQVIRANLPAPLPVP